MLVKNYNGSSRWNAPKGYVSWLDYWCCQKGLTVDCFAKDCDGSAEIGGHVVKANSQDKGVYIIPLCKKCNKRTDAFEVAASMLVPVPSRLD